MYEPFAVKQMASKGLDAPVSGPSYSTLAPHHDTKLTHNGFKRHLLELELHVNAKSHDASVKGKQLGTPCIVVACCGEIAFPWHTVQLLHCPCTVGTVRSRNEICLPWPTMVILGSLRFWRPVCCCWCRLKAKWQLRVADKKFEDISFSSLYRQQLQKQGFHKKKVWQMFPSPWEQWKCLTRSVDLSQGIWRHCCLLPAIYCLTFFKGARGAICLTRSHLKFCRCVAPLWGKSSIWHCTLPLGSVSIQR